jgi:hypothetical protein
VKRRGSAVHPETQPAEAFEPADGALDDVALPLQHGVLGVQLADGLLAWDAPPSRNERPEAMIVDKLPEAEAVVPLIGEQGGLGGLGEVRQDATQDPQRCGDVDEGEKLKRSVVLVARGHADGKRGPRPIHQQRQHRRGGAELARIAGLLRDSWLGIKVPSG